ncbi:MAG: class I SAM-dependent methyltransferase [Opitutales bacterium]
MKPEEYRKMAAVEDTMWYYRALHRHVATALDGLPEEAAVLDAGCGTGGLLKALRRAGPRWQLTGLDLSPLACELALARTGVPVAEGSVSQLPFGSGCFDAITSCDVLCQVEQPEEALREFHRCLRPGGRLVLTLPAYAWMYSYHDRQVGNLRRYRRDEVLAWLRVAGFLPDTVTYWNMLPFPLAVLRRKLLPPAGPAGDVRLYPPPLEAIFNAMMDLEYRCLRRGGRLPFGSSVLATARLPTA